jgi:hypothetical protein
VYTVEGVGLALVFPDEDPSAVPLRGLSFGATMHNVFRPHLLRRVAISRAAREADKVLHHVVTLFGEVRFQRPRWLGLFGEVSAAIQIIKEAPVDAESLTLYAGSSKDTSDQ